MHYETLILLLFCLKIIKFIIKVVEIGTNDIYPKIIFLINVYLKQYYMYYNHKSVINTIYGD